METGWLSHVGGWASAWPEGLWRASWQGALCAALVWALARAWPRMPASLRAGLWWLVALKFVVSLGWLPPVSLPLLPASLASRVEAVVSPGVARERDGVAGEGRGPFESEGARLAVVGDARVAPPVSVKDAGRAVAPRDEPGAEAGRSVVLRSAREPGADEGAGNSAVGGVASRDGGRSVSESSEAAVSGTGGVVRPEGAVARTLHVAGDVRRSGTAAASVPWGQLAVLVLLGVWGLGVLWHARSHVKGWAHMRRLRQGARPLEHPVLESEVRALSSVAGLRRPPELLVSEAVASPLATGLLFPAVVLPAKAVRRLPVEALRMALAHELAHLRRGDLWLGWVPALAEALLFFHPLARRAAREYALAREEACDAEALRLTGAEPADYGELLLAFGVARAPGTAAAMGASAHVHALHRRLSMLEHVEAVPARPRRLLKVALSVLGLAALVPFQVVAQESAGKAGAAEAKPATSEKPATASPAAAPQAKPAANASPAAAPKAKPVAEASPAAAPKASATPAPGVAAIPAVPPAPPTPGVAAVPPTPPSPRVASIPSVPPVPPMPRLAAIPPIPPVPPMPRLAAIPPVPPVPPVSRHDDDSGYVLLADGMATMNGSTVDLELARMFKKQGKELLYVRRKGEAFIIRDETTLKAVRAALEPAREMGKAQGALGEKQGALGEKQGALGEKQGELGQKQAALGLKQAELAHKQAGLGLEEMRLDSLPEAERDRRRAELRKQEKALEQEMKPLEEQMEALGEQMEALGREQEKLGEQQEALGREQEKLGEQHEARMEEAEKKVQGLIDEALKKGLGQPLPT